eukprot:CAMPEP_0206547352 /NCGR_PEP_ID=MMETSP0325_2-20121206/13247_1 /ASSEMBLY_ACC=CAM_ASM_000347 /TAXON_ID=2866 /ORGANISM="Crypthecodinium cohnii, Strain Seligo" /LENGTH=565 /DNA_ID=CAMNT_0054046645 /DNA_START=44 /DNA_END=1742 /DNA_ORIENTATION=+
MTDTLESVGHCCTTIQVVKAFLSGDGPGILGKMPLVFVLWLLKLLYCAFVFVYMPAAGIALSSPTSLIFHAFVYLTLASFFRAASTDPGGVPEDMAWRRRAHVPEGLTERKHGTNLARWDEEEGCYKPDRAHHCRVQGRTVLRMDHHCPWVGNTVGFANHKYFFNFLLWASAACGFFGVNVYQLLAATTLPGLSGFLLISSEGLTALLAGILGPFFGFHCYLIANNMTTVEYAEGFRNPPTTAVPAPEEEAKEPKLGGGAQTLEASAPSTSSSSSSSRSAYDQGFYKNVCSVLGDNPLLWIFPVGGPSGDGLRYPLTSEALALRSKTPLEAAVPRRPANGLHVLRVGPGANRGVAVVAQAQQGPKLAAMPNVNAAATGPYLAVDAKKDDDNQSVISTDVSTHCPSVQGSEPAEDFRLGAPGFGGSGAGLGLDAEEAMSEDWENSSDEALQDPEQQARLLEEAKEAAEAAKLGLEKSSSWYSASEFVEDIGYGLSYLGGAFAPLYQVADETAQRFACCVVTAPEERKARKAASWVRHGSRSLAAQDALLMKGERDPMYLDKISEEV